MGTPDLRVFWNQCRTTLSGIPESERNVALLSGFIEAANGCSPDIANHLLDEAITDPILGPLFPYIQSSIQIDESGVKRILQALTAGLSKATAFQHFGYGRVSDKIPSPDFKSIVLGVAELPEGLHAALDLLGMRLYSMKTDKINIDSDTLTLGRELLSRVDFQTSSDNFAHHLNGIARVCLEGEGAVNAAKEICGNLASALSDYRSGARLYGDLAGTLFEFQPQVALDILLGKVEEDGDTRLSFRSDEDHQSPVNKAPPETLLAWADREPRDRYPKLAEVVPLFEPAGDEDILSLSPLAMQLIEKAPDRSAVLEVFGGRYIFGGGAGSFADVMARKLPPLQQLLNHPHHDLATWAQKMFASLNNRIEQSRQQDRQVDESFE